ncbi:MAG: DUF952 domain-containing protein [Nitrososphaerales archaeon]
MAIILHVARRGEWDKSKGKEEYRGDTLDSDGFIHCSTPSQVIGVANAAHRGQNDLLLLCIDTTKVKQQIKYEKSRTKLYPHIYGPLNVDAVLKVIEFKPGKDGTFVLPEGIPVA